MPTPTALFDGFTKAEAECKRCIDADVPLAAYDQAIEASHLFNLLQARGVISVQERASYIGRVRDLAKGSCEAWMHKNEAEWARNFRGGCCDGLATHHPFALSLSKGCPISPRPTAELAYELQCFDRLSIRLCNGEDLE